MNRSCDGVELVIVRQPERYHRARYQKEGSRGCIKDSTGISCPSVQLKGYHGIPVHTQAFIATEEGALHPHPLYIICKVGGKFTTPNSEVTLKGNIKALEMTFTPDNGFSLKFVNNFRTGVHPPEGHDCSRQSMITCCGLIK